MSIRCKYLSLQEIGQRSNQEDSIYPKSGVQIPDNDLFILCDGMGGHECGEVASQTVCEAMSAHILSQPDTDFESMLDAAYDALDAVDNGTGRKMGTTMTLLKIEDDCCIVAHIGDSRVYQIRPSEKRIIYVTRDHSLVNDLIACGEMTEEEAKHSRQKNIITRAMQPHQSKRTKADVAILKDIKEGDYFYMCSDGMLEISEDEDIVNVISMDVSDEEKIEILRGVTVDNSDNHTAHLVRITHVDKASAQKVQSQAETAPVMPGIPKRKGNVGKLFAAVLAAALLTGAAGYVWYLKHDAAEEEEVVVSQEETATQEERIIEKPKAEPEAGDVPDEKPAFLEKAAITEEPSQTEQPESTEEPELTEKQDSTEKEDTTLKH